MIFLGRCPMTAWCRTHQHSQGQMGQMVSSLSHITMIFLTGRFLRINLSSSWFSAPELAQFNSCALKDSAGWSRKMSPSFLADGYWSGYTVFFTGLIAFSKWWSILIHLLLEYGACYSAGVSLPMFDLILRDFMVSEVNVKGCSWSLYSWLCTTLWRLLLNLSYF